VAQLAIGTDFMDDYSKLEKSVQALVKTAIEKFGEHTHAGIHLEKSRRHGRRGPAPSGRRGAGCRAGASAAVMPGTTGACVIRRCQSSAGVTGGQGLRHGA
jgi:hypothetical protein